MPLGNVRETAMNKWLTIALALTVAVVGALALARGGDEGHAATKSRVTSVFGVKEAPAGDLIIHITALVPPGVDERVVADAALNAQRARPATPADLQSADFTTTGLVWDQFSDALPGNDFVTQFYNNSKDPNGVDGQSALTNTQATWNAVSTSSFTLSFAGQTNRCPSLVDECQGPQTFDGFNDVTFLGLVGPCNAVFGCTLGVTWYSTSVDEADMALNTKASWVHDCNSSGSPFDVESVILHENGHVGGLGHSGDVNAVMATPYIGAQCDLDQDDIDGISALYPATGATPAPDTTAPVISSVTATGITDTSATITWTTDESADSRVDYGLGTSYGSVGSDGSLVTTHSVTLTGLNPTAAYHYKVTSSDGSGNSASSADLTFITAVVPTEATTVSASSINYATDGGKDKDKHLLITIAVVDDLNDPVGGASVSIDLFRDGPEIASGTGTTGTDGTVTFSLKNAATGCYTTDVTNVNAAGLTWDDVTPDNSYAKGGAVC